MKNWGNAVKEKITQAMNHDVNIRVYKNRPKTVTETLQNSVAKFPDKIAIIHGETKITYRKLQQKVDNMADQFKHQYGVKKGDRVALLLMNGVEFVVSAYATLQLGAIVVPLNTKCKSQELAYMLQNSGAKLLITNLDWWSNVQPILESVSIEQIFVTSDNPPTGTLPFENLVNTAAKRSIVETVNENDGAFIMYTSGTTGKPKGALNTHMNIIHSAMNYEYCYDLTSSDSTLIAVPVFHITGLAAQLTTFIYLGGTIAMMPKFEPQQFLDILEKEKITHVIASPTVYVMTLMQPNYQSFNLEHFRVAGFGGAPMPGETLKGLKNWLPHIEPHNTYGLTETTSPATIMPEEYQLEKISSVGLPTPVTEAKIVDPDTRAALKTGEIGELLFKGPMVIPYYWENEAATEKALKDGWLSTGDLAMQDEEGFIYIMDRIKDMINRGGEKIYSVEVEDVLYANTKIMEAAVVGVPDEKYGEAVKACIVPRQGENLTEHDIQDWVREHLAKYKVPAYVEFMEILPRNPNGKVEKTKLRYMPNQIKN